MRMIYVVDSEDGEIYFSSRKKAREWVRERYDITAKSTFIVDSFIEERTLR